MVYTPEPIDSREIDLPAGLDELVERLARNTHDVWASGRLAEGWRHGPRRDDAAREHPDLVPYDDLPESEKAYDRATAVQAIKAIVSLGYRIEPPAANRPATDRPADDEVTRVLLALDDPANSDLGAVLRLWQARDPESWSRSPELYRRLAERFRRLGEPLLTYDVTSEGLVHWPRDVRLRQLQGLALADSGATERALAIFQTLQREGKLDEETLGMLARAYKDLWARGRDPVERNAHLGRAVEAYEEAYRRTGGYWTGINAATMSAIVGQRERALVLARRVRQQCLEELARAAADGGDPYWPLATLGEAALVLGEWSEAEEWYRRAAGAGRGRFGSLHSTRRNARLLVEHLGGDRARFDRCFEIPRVVVFAGHPIDRPDLDAPRFPPRLQEAVADALRSRLKELNAGIGYASATCGSDILFLEAILDLGGQANVVLPYDRDQFKHERVATCQGSDWGARFDRLLGRATRVVTASDQRVAAGQVTFDYANIMLHGLASLRAEQLDTDLVHLAVWDGRPDDTPGGTAATVHRWCEAGHEVELIDLAALLRTTHPELAAVATTERAAARARPSSAPALPREIKAMLFADAVGFSKLTEEQIPAFVQHFLGPIGDLADRSPHVPLMRNTWGDGLYFVFASASDAGQFAQALTSLEGGQRLAERGLPPSLSLRIGLHAGPVYRFTDPVTGLTNYTGSHASRAARIEPITPPGQVYASEAFAALASAEGADELSCEYVGQTPYAKGYGTFPTYHVRPRPSH